MAAADAPQIIALTVKYMLEANLLLLLWVGACDELAGMARVHPATQPFGAVTGTVHFQTPDASTTVSFSNVLGECSLVIKSSSRDVVWYDRRCDDFLKAAAARMQLPRHPNVLLRVVTSVSFFFQSKKPSLNLPVLAAHARSRGWAVTALSKTALVLQSSDPGLSFDATILNTGTVMCNTGSGVDSLGPIYDLVLHFVHHYIDANSP
jgi:hypothetical protein